MLHQGARPPWPHAGYGPAVLSQTTEQHSPTCTCTKFASSRRKKFKTFIREYSIVLFKQERFNRLNDTKTKFAKLITLSELKILIICGLLCSSFNFSIFLA